MCPTKKVNSGFEQGYEFSGALQILVKPHHLVFSFGLYKTMKDVGASGDGAVPYEVQAGSADGYEEGNCLIPHHSVPTTLYSY